MKKRKIGLLDLGNLPLVKRDDPGRPSLRKFQAEEQANEAGHAVVAAYLRCSFSHVTIKERNRVPDVGGYVRWSLRGVRQLSYNKVTDTFRVRSDEEIKAACLRQISKRAPILLAARAAVDCFLTRHEHLADADSIEKSYEIDEKDFRQVADILNVPSEEFQAWREQVLAEARAIVELPFIKRAIWIVATDLQIALAKGRGLSAKHVRDVVKGDPKPKRVLIAV